MTINHIYFIRINCIVIILFTILFGIAGVARAASEPRVYLDIGAKEAPVGANIIVRILVDSEKPINALELKLAYPASLLQPVIFNDASSIVQIWQDRTWKDASGTAVLSGGLPRAFAGTKGEIGRFTFKTLKEGDARIAFDVAEIYYADGKGTRADTKIGNGFIGIRASAQPLPVSIKEEDKDVQSPTFGLIDTLTNSADGSRIAIFEVVDKGSGIDVVTLRSMKVFSWSEPTQVTNPTSLPDGIWKYKLEAKDNAGNISVKTVYIWGKIMKMFGLIGLILVFLMVARYLIIKK